jgi:hypothetical protein
MTALPLLLCGFPCIFAVIDLNEMSRSVDTALRMTRRVGDRPGTPRSTSPSFWILCTTNLTASPGTCHMTLVPC